MILAQRYMQLPMTELLIRREVRVATALRAAGAYAAADEDHVGGRRKWDSGAGVGPIKNLQQLCDESLMPITGIYMSRRTYSTFIARPAIAKYFAFRDMPTNRSPRSRPGSNWPALLELPPFIIGRENLGIGDRSARVHLER